jgi:hypothetical protein
MDAEPTIPQAPNGRPGDAQGNTAVAQGKPAKRRNKGRIKPQLLTRAELDGRTNAAKFFDRLVAAIQTDLGGRDCLSAIELALVEAFAGACVTLDNLNTRLLLGEAIDLSQHSLTVSAMVRVAARLGVSRRMRDVTSDPLTYTTEGEP